MLIVFNFEAFYKKMNRVYCFLLITLRGSVEHIQHVGHSLTFGKTVKYASIQDDRHDLGNLDDIQVHEMMIEA